MRICSSIRRDIVWQSRLKCSWYHFWIFHIVMALASLSPVILSRHVFIVSLRHAWLYRCMIAISGAISLPSPLGLMLYQQLWHLLHLHWFRLWWVCGVVCTNLEKCWFSSKGFVISQSIKEKQNKTNNCKIRQGGWGNNDCQWSLLNEELPEGGSFSRIIILLKAVLQNQKWL